MTPSYHDLYITTKAVERIAFSSLPFNCMVTCARVGGWEFWSEGKLIAGEFNTKSPLRLDVGGTVICDGFTDHIVK